MQYKCFAYGTPFNIVQYVDDDLTIKFSLHVQEKVIKNHESLYVRIVRQRIEETRLYKFDVQSVELEEA